MSPPPTTFFSPEPAGAASNAGLPVAASTLTGTPEGGTADSFDNVLAKVAPDDAASEDVGPGSPLPTAPSAEQLAWVAALMMPPAPVLPPTVTPDGGEAPAVLTLQNSDGCTVAELVATGAPVIEFQVNAVPPDAAGSTAANPEAAAAPTTPAEPAPALAGDTPVLPNAPAPVATTPKPATSVAAAETSTRESTPLAPSSTLEANQAPAAKVPPPAEAAGQEAAPARAVADPRAVEAAVATTPPTTPTRSTKAQTAPKTVAPSMAGSRGPAEEKIADGAQRRPVSGVNAPGVSSKNSDLLTAASEDGKPASRIGTTAANWGKPMLHDAHSPAAFALPHEAAAPVVGPSTEVTAPSVQPASQAGQIVRQITEIADSVSAVDRNSVEVKFNFSDQDRLSVRVEYRDGVVRATFRTDSVELRDAISREWQAQAPAERPYRMADPVFTGGAAAGFSYGDPSRQQRSPEAPAAFELRGGFAPARAASSATPAAPATPSARPETAAHLHALA